jgi:hypothetical protein
MTSYTNFCFMYHIRYSAFFGENGSIRDGLAETFWYYSQNLPTVALLLPRAALSLALLLAFGRPDANTVALADAGLLRRDGTFFRKGDGTLTGYARGVLIANAVWTAWRILVLLFSWYVSFVSRYHTALTGLTFRRLGLWILSGHACAGLCGPRYRWEEEEHEKSASVLSETGSEIDSLPWSWRDCTRLRIQAAFEFCLTTKLSARWGKKDIPDDAGPLLPPVSPSPGFEGVEQVLAAIGFPSAPQAARRGVLSDELFESPTDENPPALPELDVSAIIPKIKKMTSKERQDRQDVGPSGPLMTLPYPFTVKASQVSSDDRIPFPPSTRSSSKKTSSSGTGDTVEDEDSEEDDDNDDDDDEDDDEEESEDEDDEEEEGEDDGGADGSVDPSSGRASGSMSSLGQPVSSQYPFQFRIPQRSSGGSQMSPGPMSSPSSNSRSIHSAMSRSTGNGESSDSRSPRSNSFSIPGAAGGIPMPPRHPQQGGRGRTRAGSVPATSLPSSPISLAFPTSRPPRTRTRTDSGVSQTFGGEPEVYDSNGEEDHSDRGEVMMEQPEPEGPHEEAETGDVVGLLSPSSAGPSPRTSFVGLRSRSTSHRQRGQRSRSGSDSRSNSHSGSGSSSSRSRAGSQISEAVRLRTQSLIQAISSASKSSVDLAQSARRSRANSSMARLEEDIPYFSDVHSHSRSGSDALSSGENYTFGIPPFGHPLHPLRAQAHSAGGDTQAGEGIPTVTRTESSSQLQPSPSNLSVTAPSEHHSEQTVTNNTEKAPERPEPVEEPAGRIYPGDVDPSVTSSHPDISTASPSFVTTPPTVEGTTESSSGMQPSSWGGMSRMVEKPGGPWGPA